MMAKCSLGYSLGDCLQLVLIFEADDDDRIGPIAGEAAQRLLPLGGVGRFEIAETDAGFGLELLRPVEAVFVEGLIEFAAEAVDERGLGPCCASR